MAPVRLISLEKQFVERIDWEKIDWKDKGLINLPYVIGYYFGAKTDKMSIAKTYEDENTMIVTLQIPKSDYRNKSFQNLLKCPELPVQDEYYYRDWAVHMVMAGDNEKTVLFSHGRITLDVKDNSKADYVTVEIVIKQKEDMLRGVVFGLELDETYKEAWEKVMNPVGLNVVVPVVAASSGVVLTGIKNAKEITEDEDQDQVVDEGEREFAIGSTKLQAYYKLLTGKTVDYYFNSYAVDDINKTIKGFEGVGYKLQKTYKNINTNISYYEYSRNTISSYYSPTYKSNFKWIPNRTFLYDGKTTNESRFYNYAVKFTKADNKIPWYQYKIDQL